LRLDKQKKKNKNKKARKSRASCSDINVQVDLHQERNHHARVKVEGIVTGANSSGALFSVSLPQCNTNTNTTVTATTKEEQNVRGGDAGGHHHSAAVDDEGNQPAVAVGRSSDNRNGNGYGNGMSNGKKRRRKGLEVDAASDNHESSLLLTQEPVIRLCAVQMDTAVLDRRVAAAEEKGLPDEVELCRYAMEPNQSHAR
jgi:hypothetical protein